MALIEIRHLTKAFYPARSLAAWLRAPWRHPDPVTALQDLSLSIEEGECVCLMGPNGAGKTTLLKSLIGLVAATSGRVTVFGEIPSRRPQRAAARVGFASSERPGFYDRLTGRQNLEFFAALHGLSGAAARRRAGALLERFGIRAPDQHYQEYSAGVKQRLVLARAVLHDPQLLLLDEPTRSLDPVAAEDVRALIKDEWCGRVGKTAVVATHRASEAARLATRIAVLRAGRLRAAGTVAEIQGTGDLQAGVRALCA